MGPGIFLILSVFTTICSLFIGVATFNSQLLVLGAVTGLISVTLIYNEFGGDDM